MIDLKRLEFGKCRKNYGYIRVVFIEDGKEKYKLIKIFGTDEVKAKIVCKSINNYVQSILSKERNRILGEIIENMEKEKKNESR